MPDDLIVYFKDLHAYDEITNEDTETVHTFDIMGNDTIEDIYHEIGLLKN